MKGRIKMLFIEYPKCTTCKKAKTWLDEHGLEYTDRNIKEANPTLAELKDWYQLSGLPLKKFFNTSGVLYKQMQLKDKLPQLSEQEQLELLASDGMLVKRPLLVLDDVVLVGFKPEQWAERLK
jgi:arsenate reductase